MFSKVFGTHKSKIFFFLIFTFASQRRLLELLSYGEYNQLSISVICFLKTTLLSVFIHLFFFFSCRIKSTHIIFLPFKNIDHSNRALKTLNNIYLNKFQSGVFLQRDSFGSTQNSKTAWSFFTKVLPWTILIKLFVLGKF